MRLSSRAAKDLDLSGAKGTFGRERRKRYGKGAKHRARVKYTFFRGMPSGLVFGSRRYENEERQKSAANFKVRHEAGRLSI